MYDTYIFDFDYTLANSEQGIAMCFEMLLNDEGYPAKPRKEICQTIGMTMFDATALLTGETDSARIQELIRLYKLRYSDKYMTANTHLYPQTRPMLESLKGHGARCCIVSSKTRSRINETIQRDDLGHLIDAIIGAEDLMNHAKPDPQGINLIRQQYQLTAKDVLYIGDSLIDAQTAFNSGVDFAAVTTGTTDAQEFETYPHVKIMKNLSELIQSNQENHA